MSAIEEMRARVAAAQQAAKAAELTDEEREMSSLVEQEREAKEARAAADASRRATDLALRVAKAEARAGGRYLVAGIDLVKLFPLGTAPPVEKLPGRGVIVVRDPERDLYDRFTREVEAKVQAHSALFTELACGCLVDERDAPKDDEERATAVTLLDAFCKRFPGAAVGIGDVCAKLGGAKVAQDKRGRA